MRRVYAIDCDGTLLNRSEQITPRVNKAIQFLQQNRQKIVLATARSYDRVAPYIGQLKLDGSEKYSILFDGAQIVSNDYSQIVHSHCFSADALDEIFDLSSATQTNFIFHSARQVFATECFDGKPRSNSGYQLANFSEIRELEIFKIILRTNELNNDRKIALTKSDVNPIGRATINIAPKGASKGKALDHLLGYLSSSHDELIAIGDNLNDVSMFERADYRVAMANAKPALKAAADMVTSSNEDDGVARAIKEIEQGRSIHDFG